MTFKKDQRGRLFRRQQVAWGSRADVCPAGQQTRWEEGKARWTHVKDTVTTARWAGDISHTSLLGRPQCNTDGEVRSEHLSGASRWALGIWDEFLALMLKTSFIPLEIDSPNPVSSRRDSSIYVQLTELEGSLMTSKHPHEVSILYEHWCTDIHQWQRDR